jgi:hypothetical protein
MSDIYLQITETPTVVTLSAPVISGAVSSTVTVANTVTVALDANSLSALENVTVTVGAAITGTVTVSNFPTSQTVTFSAVSISNFPALQAVTFSGISVSNFPASQAVTFSDASLTNTQLRASAVTVGGTITVGNFPASQAVTFGQAIVSASNITGLNNSVGADGGTPATTNFIKIGGHQDGSNQVEHIVHVSAGGAMKVDGSVSVTDCNALLDGAGNIFGLDRNFPVSGTVTLGAGTAQIGSVTASISGTVPVSISSVTVGNSVTIGNFPATQAVTFGQAIVSASNITGLNNSVGTDGNTPTSTNFIKIGGHQDGANQVEHIVHVSAGGAMKVDASDSTVTFGAIRGTVTVGNSVTIGSLPAISGTVTANLSISSTAITSGSFTSLTSATLVPANTARKMATVYNLGAGQLFINAGVTATTLGGGFMVALSSGDFYECNYTTTTLSAIFANAGTASWVSY